MIIKLKKEAHYGFYIFLTTLIILLFVRYGLQINVPRGLLTLVIALIALFGNRDEILAIAMCCIPLHEAVNLYYSIGICGLVYVLKNSKHIKVTAVIPLVMSMFIWETLHCFNMDFSIVQLFISIIPLVLLMIIMCADIKSADYGFIVRIMGIVVAATCFILLANLVLEADFNLFVAFSKLRRLGIASKEDVMVGGAMNPNSLGIICVLVITGFLQLKTINRGKKIDNVLMIVLLVFGALTSSRTFLICLFMMIGLVIIGQKGDIGNRVRFIIAVVCLAVFALFLLKCFFPDLLEYYIDRFSDADITTGRDSLMIVYHNFISNNPKVMFFGIGLNRYEEILTDIYRVAGNVPHNSIQELIIAWGIPGAIMFGILFFQMKKESKRYCKKQLLLNYIPILILLTKSMAGQMLASSYTMLALSFAYLSLCQNFSEKSSKSR